MKAFIVGVVLTLAIMYPAVTKGVFGSVVDTTNRLVVSTIDTVK
jgi:hypothetical protein